MSIEQKVKEIAAEQFDVDVSTVTNESRLCDVGGDSLDGVEFIMNLESEFEIEIDEDAASNIDTLQGFVDLVTNLTEAK